MPATYRIECLSLESCLSDNHLLESWTDLVNQYAHLNVIHSSPEWITSLATTDQRGIEIWTVFDANQQLIGIASIKLQDFDLSFSIATKCLINKKFTGAMLLGGQPLFPDCQDLLSKFLKSFFCKHPEIKVLHSESTSSECFLVKHLADTQTQKAIGHFYKTDGPRPWHYVQVKNAFPEYLSEMSAKARANLRRELRILSNLECGDLRFDRIDSVDAIDEFLEQAAIVSRNSWQYRTIGERVDTGNDFSNFLKTLATKGILRSYLMKLGDEPCAFVLGYQYKNTYTYAEIGFDDRFSKYSPGKSLLYLIIEDLHQNNRPLHLNFGVGDATYKRRFGNQETCDLSFMFARKDWLTYLWICFHSLFQKNVRQIKKMIGRRVKK